MNKAKNHRYAMTIWLIFFLTGLLAVFTNCGKGSQGLQGKTGDPGLNGRDGLTVIGPTGPAGLDGLNGSNGTDASIGIVPLCPGVSTYGTFVEIGLCINGDLYAVYSANGGFMTYLAPGAYVSNAIGSACNLTVNAGCVITH